MAIERLFDSTRGPEFPDDLYTHLELPPAPDDRPYAFINMVSTVDGKILQGEPGSTAKGLGSPTDQLLMRRLQGNVQGAMIGAGTLRTGNVVYERHIWRAVVTRSGDLPLANRFFADAPDRAIIFAPRSLPENRQELLEDAAELRLVGEKEVDVKEAARVLREEFGIRALAIEGGADLNFDCIRSGIVDELFLTFAAKIKGGIKVPTIVTGDGFPADEVKVMELVSVYRDGDEMYLRYRFSEWVRWNEFLAEWPSAECPST